MGGKARRSGNMTLETRTKGVANRNTNLGNDTDLALQSIDSSKRPYRCFFSHFGLRHIGLFFVRAVF